MTPDRPDLTTLSDDDRLLDRLGHGERAEGDVEELLAGWRAGLPAAARTDPRLLAACTAAVTGKQRRRTPRRGRTARASLTAAAVALIAGGTVTVAAAHADPDSPLWPVTRVVYGDLAESRVARDGASNAVSEARAEAGQGHYPEAERLLDVADSLVAKVHEPADAQRLRQDIATVRGLLPKPQLPATSSAKAPINPAPATPDGETGGPRDKGRDHHGDRRSPDENDGGHRSDDDRNDGEDSGGEDGDERRDDGKRENKDGGERNVLPNALLSVPDVDPGELTSPAEPGY